MCYNRLMPELPEVETIRRGLQGLIVGYTIESITILMAKQFHGDKEAVIGATITSVERRGKGLLIHLSNEYSLAIHVKMTGQLIVRSVSREKGKETTKNLHPVLKTPTELPSKHTHVIFRLSNSSKRHSGEQSDSRISSGKVQRDAGHSQHDDMKGRQNNDIVAYLFYNDIRQFGWIKVVKTEAAGNLPFFQSLGPEPLSTLSIEQFNRVLSRTKAPIKQVLLDQSRMAGIGNIYANDALYFAGVHPLRPANELTEIESEKLFTGVEYVLTEGIKAGGASEENFLNALGEKGFYQEKFLVYKQTGKPCKRCGRPIERIVVGGRGTFFCPTCQD